MSTESSKTGPKSVDAVELPEPPESEAIPESITPVSSPTHWSTSITTLASSTLSHEHSFQSLTINADSPEGHPDIGSRISLGLLQRGSDDTTHSSPRSTQSPQSPVQRNSPIPDDAPIQIISVTAEYEAPLLEAPFMDEPLRLFADEGQNPTAQQLPQDPLTNPTASQPLPASFDPLILRDIVAQLEKLTQVLERPPPSSVTSSRRSLRSATRRSSQGSEPRTPRSTNSGRIAQIPEASSAPAFPGQTPGALVVPPTYHPPLPHGAPQMHHGTTMVMAGGFPVGSSQVYYPLTTVIVQLPSQQPFQQPPTAPIIIPSRSRSRSRSHSPRRFVQQPSPSPNVPIIIQSRSRSRSRSYRSHSRSRSRDGSLPLAPEMDGRFRPSQVGYAEPITIQIPNSRASGSIHSVRSRTRRSHMSPIPESPPLVRTYIEHSRSRSPSVASQQHAPKVQDFATPLDVAHVSHPPTMIRTRSSSRESRRGRDRRSRNQTPPAIVQPASVTSIVAPIQPPPPSRHSQSSMHSPSLGPPFDMTESKERAMDPDTATQLIELRSMVQTLSREMESDRRGSQQDWFSKSERTMLAFLAFLVISSFLAK